MKHHIWSFLLLLFAFAMSSCNNISSSMPQTAPLTTEPLTAQDQASLLSALKAAGATVELGDTITQTFFTPEGKIIKVKGADVQVFEYENAEAMEKEASQVAPDGGSIGTSMVDWIDTPHFYKAGRIIALYVGSDKAVLDLLTKVIGPQFAGR